ncbi:MAG: peptidylprolyl isomerase [Deltaproteobacteria bacterium]|nr:peptidylprolyl isomerase [Deltaproteobacteria bacterium]
MLSGDVVQGPAVGQPKDMRGSGMRGSGMRGSGANPHAPKGPTVPDVDLDSKDILGRANANANAYVKHVLIGWSDLLPAYRGRMDPKAMKRTNAEAAKLAQEVFAKLKAAGDAIDPIVKEFSEDPGSQTGNPYNVSAKSQFVPEFKKLALRLEDKEVGIVKTQFGYHVMKRVGKPPLDALESADILARPKKTEFAEVQHILIGWKDSPAARDPRAKTREKPAAEALAKEVLAKVRAGGDMVKLAKEYSEDPGSKDTGRTYTVTEEEQLVEAFIQIGLRLDVGEAGIVKTEFGYHVMKRVKPDPINSFDILARPVVSEKAKVKYILLGWKDGHIDDKRGEARTREEVDKLVKETLAKIANKAKFEDLMKELSEDKQSGPAGSAIEVAIPGLPSMIKMLGQRLKVDEVGVIKTQFGMFIIKRVPDDTVLAPPPMPKPQPQRPPGQPKVLPPPPAEAPKP